MKEKKNWIYDTETYPNYFLAVFRELKDDMSLGEERTFTHKNLESLCVFLLHEVDKLIGYNSRQYDDALLNEICKKPKIKVEKIYEISENIINLKKIDDKKKRKEINNIIWKREKRRGTDNPLWTSVDLLALRKGSTEIVGALKEEAVRLKLDNVLETPVPFGKITTPEEQKLILEYCKQDVYVSYEIYKEKSTQEIILHREKFKEFYPFVSDRCLSAGDAQLAEHFMTNLWRERTDKPVRQPYSYVRPRIFKPREDVDSFISFSNPENQKSLEQLKNIHPHPNGQNTEWVKDHKITFHVGENIEAVLGVGGTHFATPGFYKGKIIDIDVDSNYPSIIINHGEFPQGYDEEFIKIFKEMYDRRMAYKKEGKKTEAASMKIVVNSVYGKFSQKSSRLYEPRMSLRTTINAQLSILMLAERLHNAGYQVIHGNTDSVGFVQGDDDVSYLEIIKEWENDTGLSLSKTVYNRTFIKDSNNRVYEGLDGQIVTKGVFKNPQRKNPQVIIDGWIDHLLYGTNPEQKVKNCKDLYNFLESQKISKGSLKKSTIPFNAPPQRGVNRWYRTKKKDQNGYRICQICNLMQGSAIPKDLDRQYYIDEIYKKIQTSTKQTKQSDEYIFNVVVGDDSVKSKIEYPESYEKVKFETFVNYLKKIAKEQFSAKQNAPLFLPYSVIYRGTFTERKQENVENYYFLVLDVDDGPPLKQGENIGKEYKRVLYTSYNHGKLDENGRRLEKYRIVFPLKRPIPGSELKKRIPAIKSVFGEGVDPKSFTISQGFYLPVTNKNGIEAEVINKRPKNAKLLDLWGFEESNIIQEETFNPESENILEQYKFYHNKKYPFAQLDWDHKSHGLRGPCPFSHLHSTTSSDRDYDVKVYNNKPTAGCFHNSCKREVKKESGKLWNFIAYQREFPIIDVKTAEELENSFATVKGGNHVWVAPTGSGKSTLIAKKAIEMIKEKNKGLSNNIPVIVVPNKQLLELYAGMMGRVLGNLNDCGVQFLSTEGNVFGEQYESLQQPKNPSCVVVHFTYCSRKGLSRTYYAALKWIKQNIESCIIFIDEIDLFIQNQLYVLELNKARYRDQNKVYKHLNMCPLSASSGNCSNCFFKSKGIHSIEYPNGVPEYTAATNIKQNMMDESGDLRDIGTGCYYNPELGEVKSSGDTWEILEVKKNPFEYSIELQTEDEEVENIFQDVVDDLVAKSWKPSVYRSFPSFNGIKLSQDDMLRDHYFKDKKGNYEFIPSSAINGREEYVLKPHSPCGLEYLCCLDTSAMEILLSSKETHMFTGTFSEIYKMYLSGISNVEYHENFPSPNERKMNQVLLVTNHFDTKTNDLLNFPYKILRFFPTKAAARGRYHKDKKEETLKGNIKLLLDKETEMCARNEYRKAENISYTHSGGTDGRGTNHGEFKMITLDLSLYKPIYSYVGSSEKSPEELRHQFRMTQAIQNIARCMRYENPEDEGLRVIIVDGLIEREEGKYIKNELEKMTKNPVIHVQPESWMTRTMWRIFLESIKSPLDYDKAMVDEYEFAKLAAKEDSNNRFTDLGKELGFRNGQLRNTIENHPTLKEVFESEKK